MAEEFWEGGHADAPKTMDTNHQMEGVKAERMPSVLKVEVHVTAVSGFGGRASGVKLWAPMVSRFPRRRA